MISMSDFLVALLFFVLGLVIGVTGGSQILYLDTAVIKTVELGSMHKKYVYDTTEFNFRSDSLYNIGDTIKIVRYGKASDY